MTKHC